jgi:hypothetical protein
MRCVISAFNSALFFYRDPQTLGTTSLICAVGMQSLTQSAILPNHSDYLASRLRSLMKEGAIPASAMRKFFKIWVDIVRASTSEHPSLYPSSVEAELRSTGQTVAPNPAQKGFPVEDTLSKDEILVKRAAEATIRKCVANIFCPGHDYTCCILLGRVQYVPARVQNQEEKAGHGDRSSSWSGSRATAGA